MTDRVVVRYRAAGDTLRKFHASKDYIRILIGPLGSGKTQACIYEILSNIDQQAPDQMGVRRSRWVAARNTYPDLLNTTIKDFKEWSDGMGVGKMVMSVPPRCEIKYRKDDGTTVEAEVLFLAFDLPDDQKKARGLQLSGVWLNEMKELSRTNCDMLMSRVGRYPAKRRVKGARYSIIGDSNAPDRDHWLAVLAMDEMPEGWWFGIQPPGVIKNGATWIENPQAENLQNLPDGYYQKLIAGRPEPWIKQNLANQFVFHADGRPVHTGFNEAIHVAPVILQPGLPIVLGVDFGRTPAAVIGQKLPSGRWIVAHEICTINMNALSFGRIVRTFLNEKYPNFKISGYGDPSGTSMAQTRDETPFDMLAAAGVDIWPAPSNDFEERVTAVDECLGGLIEGQPRITIDPSCSKLRKGLAGAYQFRRIQVAGEYKYHDKPQKDPTSHVCEALQYMLLGGGEGDTLFSQPWEEMSKEVHEAHGGWSPSEHYFE